MPKLTLQARGEDVIPIPGTKNVKYLEENLGALKVKLSDADIAELEAAVPHEEVRLGRLACTRGASDEQFLRERGFVGAKKATCVRHLTARAPTLHLVWTAVAGAINWP